MGREPQRNPKDLDPTHLFEFRERLTRCREANQDAWDASRNLVGQPQVQITLKRLTAAIQDSPSLPVALRNQLVGVLREGTANRIQELPGEGLRQLTGFLPPKPCVLCASCSGSLVRRARPRLSLPLVRLRLSGSFGTAPIRSICCARQTSPRGRRRGTRGPAWRSDAALPTLEI